MKKVPVLFNLYTYWDTGPTCKCLVETFYLKYDGTWTIQRTKRWHYLSLLKLIVTPISAPTLLLSIQSTYLTSFKHITYNIILPNPGCLLHISVVHRDRLGMWHQGRYYSTILSIVNDPIGKLSDCCALLQPTVCVCVCVWHILNIC